MKRLDDSNHAGSSKKQKLDHEPLDWDDFPSDNDLDDIIIAEQVRQTQVSLSQSMNITTVPNYSAFKLPNENDIITSTQFQPNTSVLQQSSKYEAELFKLRGDLEVTKTKLHKEKTEIERINTQLNYKELENVNLKRRLHELSKTAARASTSAAPQNQPKTENKDEAAATAQLEVTSFQYYPTKDIPSTIFQPARRDLYPKLNHKLQERVNLFKISNNDTLEIISELNPHKTRLNNSDLGLNFAYVSIDYLKRCNNIEFNSQPANDHINTIYLIVIELLFNLNEHLKCVEKHTHKEDICKLDLLYLNSNDFQDFNCDINLFDPSAITNEENGIECRQAVSLVAALLPHNKYLQELMSGETQPKLCTLFTRLKSIKYAVRNKSQFLMCLLSVITIIGRIRAVNKYSGLLAAACSLLQSIYSITSNSEIAMKIVKEIIYTRCNLFILPYLTKLIRIATHHNVFVDCLCDQSLNNNLKENYKDGIATITQDCCPIQIFVRIYRYLYIKNTAHIKSNETYTDFLNIVINVYTSNSKWCYISDKQHFDCLLQLTKLTIEICYIILRNRRHALDNESITLCLNVMQMVNYRSFEYLKRNLAMNAKNIVVLKMFCDHQEELHLDNNDFESLQRLLISSMEMLESEVCYDELARSQVWNSLI